MSFLSTATGVAVLDTRTRPGTITLPLTSQIVNRYLQFKDLYGAFGRSSLTVSTQAGESFDDGTTSKVFTDPYTFLQLYAASTTKWAQLGGTQTIQQTVSSLNVSSITIGSGLGWLQLPPIQTVAVSTNTINADNMTINSTTSMYISAQILYVSSIMGVTIGGGTGNVTTANLTSTVGGLGQIYLSTGGGGGITTANLVSTTANLTSAATQFVSSLTINTLTIGSGAGWLQLPPLQTIYASTTYTQAQSLTAISSYFGAVSTLNTLDFYGLLGNYNNTVLAEVSTGAGSQEFLVFKGSSASDRVRVQTTGNFVVETGVSARLWNDSTVATLSNATPAFIVNTSSNVGIQTATPGATLDVAGTGRFQVVSTQNINLSTINGLSFGGPINSTVIGLGSSGYISSFQLISTTAGLIEVPELISTVGGLGQIYLSTATGGGATTIPANLSTTAFYTSSIQASTINTSSLTTNNLVVGTGTGWIQISPIQTIAVSSIQENTNNLYAANANIGILSSVNSLQYNGLFANFNNTVLAEISTGAGTQEFLVFKGSSASDRVRFQTTGNFVIETGVSTRLWNSNTTQTLSNVTPAFIVNTSSNVGIQTATPGATFDVAGTGRFQLISTLGLNISTINGQVYTAGLTTTNLTSTVGGLGQIYLSTATGGGITTANLTSTVGGLGQIYLSTAAGGAAGPVPFLSSFSLSTGFINVSSVSAITMNISTTATISSLIVNSLQFGDGTGWVNLGPLQTVALSSIQTNTNNLYAANAYIGITSTVNALAFNGLLGNYNNTVLAELSTGAGTQEMLMFKGSSINDRIRMQTTGSIVFEPGVSSRLFSNTTIPTLSNATPAMIINTSSNVGIQTASPGATLDVAGIGRFQAVSTQQIQASTIQVPFLSTQRLLASSVQAAFVSTQGLNASSIFTPFLYSFSTLTSTLIVNGSEIVKYNGSASASLYGYGTDTLTLQYTSNNYVGAIASLAFAGNAASYPLARIYALDSAVSGSPISQLIFQNTPTSATSFSSNFSYTGANQSFTVPTGVTSVQVSLWGAGGAGGYNGGGGGAGCFVQGVLTVSAGQTYTLVVGQGGIMNSSSATYGGGGGSGGGSSGGGRSAILLNLTVTVSSASGSGSAITFTTSGTHGLLLGQPVVISGLSPSGFNGNFAVASLPASNQFTVVSTQSGSSTGTGTILAEVVNAGGGGSGGYNGGLGGAAQYSGTALDAPDNGAFRGGKGGTQTAGGAGGAGSTYSGSILLGGTGLSLGGGGGGGFYGGGGGEWSPGGAAGGGGGSTYTSYTGFTLIQGLNSPNNGTQAPGTSITGYIAGVAVGGPATQTTSTGNGGNGLILLNSIGGSMAEAMRIGTNGFVGIANISPSYPLDVGGNARMSNMYLGTNSTLITQQFYGLFGAYNNTVLAEISTGGGTQELLVFKGSSVSDRVRVQTTGNFVVETGVSGRLWSTNTAITASNVTPAFIVNSSSNVGIQTATPGATLDVAGTGRFQILSTLNINLSSINGQAYSAGLTTGNLTSTVGGLGQIYLSTGGGGTGGGAINYVSAFTVSTASLFTSSLSSYVIEAYGIFGTAFFNLGSDEMNILTSVNNLNITSSSNLNLNANNNINLSNPVSTIVNTNSLYLGSSNEARIVSLSNIYLETPYEVITSSIYSFGTVSTHSLVVYGPSTLTVQGLSYFQNVVSSPTMITNSIGVIDMNTSQPSYLQVSSGTLTLNGGPVGGGLTVSDYVCQGKLNANQAITSGSDAVVPFVSDFDPQGWIANAGTATARFLPNIAGYYVVSYQVWWAAAAGTGQVNIQIRKGGVGSITISQEAIPNTEGLYMNNTKIVYLNGTTDYLDFTVYSSTTDPTHTIQYGGTGNGTGTWFSASLVSGGGGGVTKIVAGSNVTIDPIGGTGVVTINATGGGGGGSSGPIDVLSSPVKIGSLSSLSQLGFYGLTDNFTTAVLAQASKGPGAGELLMFKGSSINDQIRLTTTGNIVFEPQIAQTQFPNVPPLATPTMIMQSNLVGINTNNPTFNFDVTGGGRFTTLMSTTNTYTGGLYMGIFFA